MLVVEWRLLRAPSQPMATRVTGRARLWVLEALNAP